LRQEHVCGDPVKTAAGNAGYSRSDPYHEFRSAASSDSTLAWWRSQLPCC